MTVIEEAPTCEQTLESCDVAVEALEDHNAALDKGLSVCEKGLETCREQVEKLEDRPSPIFSGIIGMALGVILAVLL